MKYSATFIFPYIFSRDMGDMETKAKPDDKLNRWKDIRLLLILPLLFNIILLLPVFGDGFPKGGDTIGHLLNVDTTKEIVLHFIETGELKLWQPLHFMGYPLFYYYSPLSYLILAILSILTGIKTLFLFKAAIFLGYLLLPITVYCAARLINLNKTQAIIASMLTVLPSSVYGFGMEYRTLFDFGLFTQLWGMHAFILGFAFCYNYVFQTESAGTYKQFVWTAVITSFAFLSHLLAGYFIVFFLVVCIIIKSIHMKKFPEKTIIKRFTSVIITTLLLSSFILYPYLFDKEHYGGLPLDPPERQLGLGIAKVTEFLIKGDLLDYHNKIPVLTLLLFISLSVYGISLFSTKANADPDNNNKFLMSCIIISLFISFFMLAGKKTFPILSKIPTLSDLQTFRFIFPFQFFSILLIAMILPKVQTLLEHGNMQRKEEHKKEHKKTQNTENTVIAIVFITLILTSYGTLFMKTKELTKPILDENNNKEFYTFVKFIDRLPKEGRMYFKQEDITAASPLQAMQYITRVEFFNTIGLGHHDTHSVFYSMFPLEILTTDAYRLFNIRYVLSRDEQGKPMLATVPYTGYFEFGNAKIQVKSSLKEARETSLAWLMSKLPEEKQYMIIAGETQEEFPIVLEVSSKQKQQPLITVQDTVGSIGNEGILNITINPENMPSLKYRITEKEPSTTSTISTTKAMGEAQAFDFFNGLQFSTEKTEETEEDVEERCGEVLQEYPGGGKYGTYEAIVQTQEQCFLLLKVSYHPQWSVTVDGKEQENFAVAPNLMGTFVNEGRHRVTYEYQESTIRKATLIASIFFFLGVCLWLMIQSKYSKRNK